MSSSSTRSRSLDLSSAGGLSPRAGPALRALLAGLACSGLGLAFAAGCHQDMRDQPRYEPLEASEFFEDGMSSRPLVPGTVARGELRVDRAYPGRGADSLRVQPIPVRMTDELLERGRERYEIFCTPCHDRVGTGNGMIVRRGFKRPPSYHIDRLRKAPIGYFYEVITHGYGAMPSHASQVPPDDRWAIAAYVRALQLSQNAPLADLTDAEREELRRAHPPAARHE